MGGMENGMGSFSEREFYLSEFRGRTIAIGGAGDLTLEAHTENPTAILKAGGARVVVLSLEAGDLEFSPGFETDVWRMLSAEGEAHLCVANLGLNGPLACAQAASRLGVSKWVWLDPKGGLFRRGRPVSFVTHGELSTIEGDDLVARRDLWRAVQVGLESGISSINVCSPEGLEAELFTYAGSGTLFTRERYIKVRSLGVDDYDKAADLLARGSREGYLVPRNSSEHDQLLVHGFGAFVQGNQLAGIGSLLRYSEKSPLELAGLYTLTRFLGEGIGGHLVAHAKEEAGRLGFNGLFACTTSARVGVFFERYGFKSAPWQSLPDQKWENPDRPYDEKRRESLLCFLAQL